MSLNFFFWNPLGLGPRTPKCYISTQLCRHLSFSTSTCWSYCGPVVCPMVFRAKDSGFSALSPIHVLTFEIPSFTMKEDIVRKANAKQFDEVHIVPNLYEIYGPSCLVLKGAVPSCEKYICPIDTFIIKIRRTFLDTILYKHG